MKIAVAIIGSGPSALILAAELDPARYDVTIYERNAAPARKFLVAGDGGFNLTHSEPPDTFAARYHPAGCLDAYLRTFSPADLRAWLLRAGIPTYTGTSGRIFPEKGIKPVQVLDAILTLLKKKGVRILTRHRWTGWKNDALCFETRDGMHTITPAITVFALGGSSWSVTGSDGSWAPLFTAKGITVHPFEPSNCSVIMDWPAELVQEAEGLPLKNIAIRCGDAEKKGEAVITARGLEGGAVYFHSPAIRRQLKETGRAQLLLDLRPDLTVDEVLQKLRDASSRRSRKEQLRQALGLGKAALALLRHLLPKESFTSDALLAQQVKALPVTVTGLGTIDDAISTAGGIAFEAVDAHGELRKMPGTFVVGEMLDWDAPTGGYLLQACFSMGFALAQHLNGRAEK